jgi:sugar phosphate isomerase/epimerase
MPSRRDFMRTASSVVVATGASLLPADRAVASTEAQKQDKFCAFTESFQAWPIDTVCARFKAIGLDGLDLTVRPGGHIDPAAVAEKLPQAARSAEKHGVRISMLSTAITEANQQTESLLAVAGDLGIKLIKLGYYRAQKFGALLREIDEVRRSLDGVAKLASKYQVLPCVHIHSGEMIPASGAVAHLLLRDRSPKEIGAYVDPMHMTIEGGLGGWRQGLDLLAPWIAISSLKNFKWTAQPRDEHGQVRWRVVKCPLADGVAPIPDYLAALRQLGYHGLYSLHSEYSDSNSWKQLSIEECLQQTAKDFEFASRI